MAIKYILSNMFLGRPKLSKYQIEYFEDYFLPLIEKRGARDDDKIIITGDIFFNTTTVNFSFLKQIKTIFYKLSMIIPIEIVGNDYCFDIISDGGENHIKKYMGSVFNDVNKISLFDFKGNENPVGFDIIKDGEIKFIENKKSPRFIDVRINKIEDLVPGKNDKDFIDYYINNNLMENLDTKNKINIFLAKNNPSNVYFFSGDDDASKKKMNAVILPTNGNINLRELIINNIDDELKEEMMNIFKISDNSL